MPKTILFDFFGTLVNYAPASYFTDRRQKAYQYLYRAGLKVTYEAFSSTYIKIYQELESQANRTYREFNMEFLMRHVLSDLGRIANDENFFQEFIDLYLIEWNLGVHYVPGIRELVSVLADNYQLGIVTNTHSASLIHGHLREMRIAPYFSTVVTSVEFGWRKPSPLIFNHALRLLKISPQQSIFVGDSYSDDYMGATQAGMTAVLINPKNAEAVDPAQGISSISQLPRYLTEKGF